MKMAKESVLERILKEIPNSPHPSFVPKSENPFIKGEWFDVGRRAIEILEDPAEIKEFMGKYSEYIHNEYGLDPEKAEREAKEVVGYCTGYVDDDRANAWFRTLPDITHPITGRKRPFTEGNDSSVYYVIGQSGDREVREYLAKTFSDPYDKSILSLFGFELLDQEPIPGKDNPSYFSFRFKPVGDGSGEGTIFLKGYIIGLVERMREDIGKSCKLSLESVR